MKANPDNIAFSVNIKNKLTLTLFGMGFFMYAKRMGGGGKNYPPTLTFEPKELQC